MPTGRFDEVLAVPVFVGGSALVGYTISVGS